MLSGNQGQSYFFAPIADRQRLAPTGSMNHPFTFRVEPQRTRENERLFNLARLPAVDPQNDPTNRLSNIVAQLQMVPARHPNADFPSDLMPSGLRAERGQRSAS